MGMCLPCLHLLISVADHEGFRNMNKWAIDNFMTYVCALTLTIDLYEVDISDIRDDLRLETKQ